MIQITEDTPPDMLAGAMDLTVHLPNGNSVKMSVERSTPMMDLLVQITTTNHLQLSNHTLQALGMAPSSEHSDKILPFKPNTPIGALDTQHIRVLPKGRTLPAPKYTAPGHQPFESTFRLKVHLPRNQLYVTRVSRNVLLEDIMKKVCEEKNLDPLKYEFKHPGNLDQALDPKLTLSDYQITEIYVVIKGTTNLSQAFSAADIMVLRKEEERKQMHTKTGGGVFNLIFKRGKSSMGSGSVSSDNRSISPTHSDDSRSVTPPAVQEPPIVAPPKKDPPPERPKPPQKKRRPAPKPPQIQVAEVPDESRAEKSSSVVSNEEPSNTLSQKSSENGLTICHSRNSSDSSGYHEASILSDHCANTSLPRTRPKSAFVGEQVPLQSTSNLSKMSLHSRSTTSLVAGRKKKAAPPPPPVPVSPVNSVVTQSEKPSPLVASQSDISTHEESITSLNLMPVQTPPDSIPPFPLENRSSRIQSEEKSLESTDSGIAQETHSHIEKNEEDFGFYTPPPPPILDDIQQEEISHAEVSEDIKPVRKQDRGTTELSHVIKSSTTVAENLISNVLDKNPKIEELNTKETKILVESVEPLMPKVNISSPLTTVPSTAVDIQKQERTLPINTIKSTQPDSEVADIEWHYQLPSPPKAFRDSSPAHLIINKTNSVNDFKDSVVTSPELFEKLRSLEDSQSEKDTLKSEITSTASDEPLNMLSLEHLEKRKSLVYNRELATSLKMTDSVESNTKTTDNFTSSITSFQSTYDELNKTAVQQTQPCKPARTTVASSNHHTLPNFKITTYDVPKQNITVFEDDTISSNTNMPSNLTKTRLGRSMDNISFAKKAFENGLPVNNEQEYKFYRPQTTNLEAVSSVSRSESFSTDHRLPLKPVLRSKSTLTMNKPQVSQIDETSISRSNSLFDVSGLQSLEVMKLIRNKLNTPTGSMENINFKEKEQSQFVPQKPLLNLKTDTPKAPEPQPIEEKPKAPSPQPVKKYYYRGPPAVNMTTWSERPKVPVSVKEDEDYTLGNVNVSSKLIVNTTSNNITSNNSIEVRNGKFPKTSNYIKGSENKNVSVNVNGIEQISQPSNNVVIKIGGMSSNNYIKNLENQRFVGPTAYRKPFSTINRNGSSVTTTQRPHSIALPSDFDISRVPVVRSVEFKKPFKDFHGSNTSITHINQEVDDFRSLNHNTNKSESFVEKFKSTESLRSIEKKESEPNKRVFRVGSFKPAENNYSTPVIRGFKSTDRDVNHRLSWNPSSTYNTLPAKSKMEKDYTTNQHVPFSQSTLKRTSSSKIYSADQNYNAVDKTVLKEDKNYIEESFHNSLPPTITHNKVCSVPKVASVPPTPPAPPAPPHMPKVTLKKFSPQDSKSRSSPTDARDMLLDSIRNFGGKKGLKSVKV